MKKKLTAVALVVCMLAVMLVGASLAYFTDTKTATNTFTVGNVKIELLESKLHRENAGVENGKTSTSELWSNVNTQGSNNTNTYKKNDFYYTDAQIEADAKEYKCENIKLNPGQSYHKMPYVKNTGANDAYIRIRVMIPADLDTAVLNSSMFTDAAMSTGEFTKAYDSTGAVKRTVKIGGTNKEIAFSVYTFTRTEALKPNELTYWNVWGTIHMDADVTNEKIETLFGEGKTYVDDSFPVLVEADAIQADGFASAAEAFAAFDAE